MINVLMAESFSRVYQVLPMRTHPENNMNGLAGFVLSATKVDPVAPVLAVAEKVLVAADPVAADEGGDVPENTAVEGGDVVDCDVKNRA